MKYHVLAVIFLVGALATGKATAMEYVVKVKDGNNFDKTIASLETQLGIKLKPKDLHITGNLIKINIGSSLTRDITSKKISMLTSRKDIQYMVPNIRFHTLERSNDPRLSEQWALETVQAFAAWDKNPGSNKVVVAVIDTGADKDHEDLVANMWANKKEIPDNKIDDDGNGYIDDIGGWDFFDNDNTPMDETSASGNPGHGTHCSGIVGAVGNNKIGISGISQKVSIMPIRFLGADGSGDLFNSTKAIDYAIANGAHIISASWGANVSRSDAQPIIDAIDRANQKGILFVTAAGNDGASNDTTANYPSNAGLDNVIDVAASDELDKKPEWSNYGKYTVDLASPGASILSTLPKNKYGKLDGTSMATPLVAGLAAVLKSQDISLTPREIRSILQSSGKKVDIETACGCRIDANAALDVVIKKTLTVTPAAAHVDVGASLQMSAFGGKAPYTFSSTDPDIATVSSDGKLTGVKEGDVKVVVKDSAGKEAKSLDILVGSAPKESKDCPYKNPETCEFLCMINPNNPWCSPAE